MAFVRRARLSPPPVSPHATAARLRHERGARLLVRYGCRKPYAPIPGAFEVGAAEGVKGGALIPAAGVGLVMLLARRDPALPGASARPPRRHHVATRADQDRR